MQDPDPGIHQHVYSDEMVVLVSVANETSAFLEQLKGTSGKEFIEAVVSLLPSVYAAMLKIGDTEPVFELAAEPVVTEQDWAAIYQRIAALLGPYNEILRPAEEGEYDRTDLVTHTISEDLADVYQELKNFISIYSRGVEEMMNDAAWELKERFAEHWGEKLLRALSAIHRLFVTGTDPEEKL